MAEVGKTVTALGAAGALALSVAPVAAETHPSSVNQVDSNGKQVAAAEIRTTQQAMAQLGSDVEVSGTVEDAMQGSPLVLTPQGKPVQVADSAAEVLARMRARTAELKEQAGGSAVRTNKHLEGAAAAGVTGDIAEKEGKQIDDDIETIDGDIDDAQKRIKRILSQNE